MESALIFSGIAITWVFSWMVLGPVAESKNYSITWLKAIPVANTLILIGLLLVPRRGPRTRLITPKQQAKRYKVVRPDSSGRYRR